MKYEIKTGPNRTMNFNPLFTLSTSYWQNSSRETRNPVSPRPCSSNAQLKSLNAAFVLNDFPIECSTITVSSLRRCSRSVQMRLSVTHYHILRKISPTGLHFTLCTTHRIFGVRKTARVWLRDADESVGAKLSLWLGAIKRRGENWRNGSTYS